MSIASPALLGALMIDDDRRTGFTVYVLDLLLTRAAVADTPSRVTDLTTAIAEVLASRGPIVSWSDRELRIVQSGGLPARLVRRFEARWVNAVTDVRRWRRRLYRDWMPSTLSQPDMEQLETYKRAVGHTLRPLALSSAARRLRHLRQRAAAVAGEYRTLSAAAQREWQTLLEHHRHDCEGLRAVYERATRELRLEAAYRQTTYLVDVDGASVPIRIGRSHRALDTAVRATRATRWVCVTAFNPQSARLSRSENQRRDVALKQRLHMQGIRWHPVEAVGDDGDWPPEMGVLALGVSRRWAERTGREFDQAAVVWGRAGGCAELVWCNQGRKSSCHAGLAGVGRSSTL
jgi:hypothetical protein